MSNAVWGPWTIALLLGTGLFLTLRFRFVQLTRFRQAAAGLVPRSQAGARGVLSPLAVVALLFGYTTLIGWGYYGEQFLQYVLGVRVTTPYRWIYCTPHPAGRHHQRGAGLGLG